MPFAQELDPMQAVLAYLWGESTHSFATQPAKAGESVRTVGTDPFIVGSRARKVNRFHDIIMDLIARYPGKVRFFQYNTGGVGEILEQKVVDGKKVKNLIRKVERVPLDLMAAIQRGDLRSTNVYEEGRLGTKEIAKVEGFDLSPYAAERLYDKEKIEFFVQDLVDGRREFTEEIVAEGLNPDIRKAALASFNVARTGRTQVAPYPVVLDSPEKTESAPMPDYFKDYEPVRRPKRPMTGRHW